MRNKKLISMLMLSAGFVACTQDEIVENGFAGIENQKDLVEDVILNVSLGENVLTRAEYAGDKDGNVLEEDDSASISKADLTEYTFNTNHFDFSSLLSAAGNYRFYVSAVLSAGANFVESGYTSSISYMHLITLETPHSGLIKKVGSDFMFLTTIDTRANALTVECNGVEKTI